ncbi:MAG TPA: recombinase family protein, partial [Noviherbaspirillum sp.]
MLFGVGTNNNALRHGIADLPHEISGLERLRDTVALGGIDRLYVHSPDRLARKFAYQVVLIDELQRAGVEIVFINHAMGQTPEENPLLQVQGMVAEDERAKIIERSRRGNDTR